MRQEHVDLSSWDTNKLSDVSAEVLEYCSDKLHKYGASIWVKSSESKELKRVIHSLGGHPVQFKAMNICLEFRWPPRHTLVMRDEAITWIQREPKFTFLLDDSPEDGKLADKVWQVATDLQATQPLVMFPEPITLIFPRGVYVEQTNVVFANQEAIDRLEAISRYRHGPSLLNF